jgi:hypothetical protein
MDKLKDLIENNNKLQTLTKDNFIKLIERLMKK